MIPAYFALDCIPAADGSLRVADVWGGLGGGLSLVAEGYLARSEIRARIAPYLQRLGEYAGGKQILFYHDPFAVGPPFPDDFFNLVQRYIRYSPVTDWVPDLQQHRRQAEVAGVPDLLAAGRNLDALARRIGVRLGYCGFARVEHQQGEPKLLLSEYRRSVRGRAHSVIVSPDDVGLLVYNGTSERFPDDLKRREWFPVLNPPLQDELLENRWLVSVLLEGTPAARLLPRRLPVGMGFRTAQEVREFAEELRGPGGYPLAVLKPSHRNAFAQARFLDLTALRALAARQPPRRLPARLAEELIAPRVSHSYEELAGYRGKQLDNLLRIPGAAVRDLHDGSFHYSAPYPFLETTVAMLQEYVEARPVPSRRTGKLHRGSIRVVMFDGWLVAAVYRLESEPEDGVFRNPNRPGARFLLEPVPPEQEAQLQAQLSPFVLELERQSALRVRTSEDLARLKAEWVRRQTDGS